MTKKKLSHLNDKNQPEMVTVSEKEPTFRTATAQTTLLVPKEIFKLIDSGEILTKKGAVFSTAIIAGTMAVKKTSDLIPLCHPLPIEGCQIRITTQAGEKIVIECSVQAFHKTGVEMEALTGASIAALTVYDMCKAVSHDIQIVRTQLMEKRGGKNDYQRKP